MFVSSSSKTVLAILANAALNLILPLQLLQFFERDVGRVASPDFETC
jgi:hypothetical protein